MTREDFDLWNNGNGFYVTYECKNAAICTRDLEQGSAPITARFNSTEAREYYINAEIYRDRLNQVVAELEAARSEIVRVQTLRGAWENLKQALRTKI